VTRGVGMVSPKIGEDAGYGKHLHNPRHERSRSTEIVGHALPKSPVTINRNTQLTPFGAT